MVGRSRRKACQAGTTCLEQLIT
uniref:Uncharacterized protein n=1 Tax=Arundo donax TaxID=35708 RepID=A0A0A8ZMK9_ARUDO